MGYSICTTGDIFKIHILEFYTSLIDSGYLGMGSYHLTYTFLSRPKFQKQTLNSGTWLICPLVHFFSQYILPTNLIHIYWYRLCVRHSCKCWGVQSIPNKIPAPMELTTCISAGKIHILFLVWKWMEASMSSIDVWKWIPYINVEEDSWASDGATALANVFITAYETSNHEIPAMLFLGL